MGLIVITSLFSIDRFFFARILVHRNNQQLKSLLTFGARVMFSVHKYHSDFYTSSVI